MTIVLAVLMLFVGILLLGLLAALWSRVTGQGRAISSLQSAYSAALERILALERELRQAREARADVLSDARGSPPASAPTVVSPPTAPAPATPESPPAQQALADMFQRPGPQRRSRAEWEALIGGKLLNRIGALALIIGAGFFLKHAFDNNWISETVRVAIGVASGILLFFIARRAHLSGYRIFAQGLVGAGIAVLYLSCYAGFNFYRLIPAVAAYVLMTAVTVTAFHQALRYDSLATALLGWAGGFLTPYLLGGGEPGQPGLFTYLALLTAGILAITAAKDSWAVLHPLTLAATYLAYFSWFREYYSGVTPLLTGFFLTVFWALFLALETVQERRGRRPLRGFGEVLSVLNPLLFFIGMYRLVNPDYHEWMGPVTLLIGAVYAVLYLRRHDGAVLSGSRQRLLLTAVAFLVIGTEIHCERFVTVILWAIEAAALLWLGARFALRPLVWSGAGLLVLDSLRLVLQRGALATADLDSLVVVMNGRALAFAVLTGAMVYGAFLLAGTGGKREARFGALLQYLWCLLLLIGVTVEINDGFRREMVGVTTAEWQELSFLRFMTFAFAWMAASLGLAFYGRRKPHPPVIHAALFALALSLAMAGIRGIAFDPPANFHLLMNSRALVLLLLIAGSAAHLLLLRKETPADPEGIRGFVGVGLVLLALTLVTGETRDYFRREMVTVEENTLGEGKASVLERLENQKQLSLSAVWLLSSIGIMGLGLWRQQRNLRIISIAVFGLTILKIFIYDLSFLETLYRIFSFVGLGVILLGVSYLYQRYKQVIMR